MTATPAALVLTSAIAFAQHADGLFPFALKGSSPFVVSLSNHERGNQPAHTRRFSRSHALSTSRGRHR